MIESVSDWFTMTIHISLSIILLWKPTPTTIGHAWGPESNERIDAMKDFDEVLMKLQDEVESRKMDDEASDACTLLSPPFLISLEYLSPFQNRIELHLIIIVISLKTICNSQNSWLSTKIFLMTIGILLQDDRLWLRSIETCLNLKYLSFEILFRYDNDYCDAINLQVVIVVVSDHGMLNVDPENKRDTKLIDIDTIIDPDDISVMLDRGSTSFLYPVRGREEKVYQALVRANRKGLRFYQKAHIPEEYHIKNNERTAPILLVADKGYFLRGVSITILDTPVLTESRHVAVPKTGKDKTRVGCHLFWSSWIWSIQCEGDENHHVCKRTGSQEGFRV